MWASNQMDKINRKMNSGWSRYWRMKGIDPDVERYQERFNKIVGALDHENLRKLVLKETCDKKVAENDEKEMMRRMGEAELDWFDPMALKLLAWQYIFADFYFRSTRGDEFVRYSFYQPNKGAASFLPIQQICQALWDHDPWLDEPESEEAKEEHRQYVLRKRAEREEVNHRIDEEETETQISEHPPSGKSVRMNDGSIRIEVKCDKCGTIRRLPTDCTSTEYCKQCSHLIFEPISSRTSDESLIETLANKEQELIALKAELEAVRSELSAFKNEHKHSTKEEAPDKRGAPLDFPPELGKVTPRRPKW